MFKAVAFDLDGTLLDTLDDIADTANHILRAHGFPTHSNDSYQTFVGHGFATTITRALPQAQRDSTTVSTLSNEFEQLYAKNANNKTRPYPGIADLLTELVTKNIRLAVLSNKAHAYTQQYVQDQLSTWSFDIVLGQREGVAKKPDPAGALEIADFLKLPPQDIIYVGDSGVDMQTAVSADMYPVGVSWGFRPQDELQNQGAKAIIHQPSELLALLKSSE